MRRGSLLGRWRIGNSEVICVPLMKGRTLRTGQVGRSPGPPLYPIPSCRIHVNIPVNSNGMTRRLEVDSTAPPAGDRRFEVTRRGAESSSVADGRHVVTGTRRQRSSARAAVLVTCVQVPPQSRQLLVAVCGLTSF